MGWTFHCNPRQTRADFVAELTRQSRFGDNYKLLRSRLVGSNLWHLARLESSGRVLIFLDMLSYNKTDGWGYKELTEDCGPTASNCPLSFIDAASPPPQASYAVDWRKRVIEHHAKAKTFKSLISPGLVVRYGDCEYRLLGKSMHRKKGWAVQRCSDAKVFYMSSIKLHQSQVVTPA